MTLLAVTHRWNMIWRFAKGYSVVVAARAGLRNSAVIETGWAPAYGRVAGLTLVAGGDMVWRFPRSAIAIVAADTRTLELTVINLHYLLPVEVVVATAAIACRLDMFWRLKGRCHKAIGFVAELAGSGRTAELLPLVAALAL